MKESELMKYDWVMFDEECYEPYEIKRVYVQVHHFNYGTVYGNRGHVDGTYIAHCEESDYYNSRRYGIVMPIPLTEKILKLNELDPNICCDLSMPRWFMSLRSGNNHVEMPFQYVHELQHALRLCGLNEMADNFKV